MAETHLDGRPFAEARSAQMSVRDLRGNLLTRWGGDDPCAPGSFASPHGMCLDSRGNLYVGEVTHTALSRSNRWHTGVSLRYPEIRAYREDMSCGPLESAAA